MMMIIKYDNSDHDHVDNKMNIIIMMIIKMTVMNKINNHNDNDYDE